MKRIFRRIFSIAISRGFSVGDGDGGGGVGNGVGGGGVGDGVGDGGVGDGDGGGVGGGVGLPDGVCTSNAPISLRPFFTRSNRTSR